jgi:hypothetical protein
MEENEWKRFPRTASAKDTLCSNFAGVWIVPIEDFPQLDRLALGRPFEGNPISAGYDTPLKRRARTDRK